MSTNNHHLLDRVEESIDQLISITIEWLTLEAHSPEQLALIPVRISELRGLQEILRKQIKSGLNSDHVWLVVQAIINAIITVVLTRLSDSIHYSYRRGYSWKFIPSVSTV
jgi:hypothetical protein